MAVIEDKFFELYRSRWRSLETYQILEIEEVIAERLQSHFPVTKLLSFCGWHFEFVKEHPRSFAELRKLFRAHGIDRPDELTRLTHRMINLYSKSLTVSENRKLRDEFDALENLPVLSETGNRVSLEWAKSYENSSKAIFRKPTKSQGAQTTVADDQVAEQIFQFCIAPGDWVKEVINRADFQRLQSRYKRDLKRDLNRYRLNLYLSALDTSLTKFAESLDKNYLDFYGRLNPAIRNRNSVNIRLTILAKLVDVHLGREKHSFDSFEQRFNRLISGIDLHKTAPDKAEAAFQNGDFSNESAAVFESFFGLECPRHKSFLKDFAVALGDKITTREGTILKRRLLEGKTLEQIGLEFGITRERVRQIERKTSRGTFGKFRLDTNDYLLQLLEEIEAKLGPLVLIKSLETRDSYFKDLEKITGVLDFCIDRWKKSEEPKALQLSIEKIQDRYLICFKKGLVAGIESTYLAASPPPSDYLRKMLRDGETIEFLTNAFQKKRGRKANLGDAVSRLLGSAREPISIKGLIAELMRLGFDSDRLDSRKIENVAGRNGLLLDRGFIFGGRNCLKSSDAEIREFCNQIYLRFAQPDFHEYFFDLRDEWVIELGKELPDWDNFGVYGCLACLRLDPDQRFSTFNLSFWLAETGAKRPPTYMDLATSILSRLQKPMRPKEIRAEIKKYRSVHGFQLRETDSVKALSGNLWTHV